MLSLLSDPIMFVFWAVGLLIAVTIHEFSHALLADRLGDPTPRVQGRLTLNPIRHLDPIGTLALLLVGFGWGKPVQFDPYNLANPRRDAAIISVAGPISNILLAISLSIVLRLMLAFSPIPFAAQAVLFPIIYINVILAIFNLIPIHPLDGGKILIGLLPPDVAHSWDRILHQYGIFMLLFLILPIFGQTSLVFSFISPTINFILSLLIPGPRLI